jgi:hypothetical protein
MYHRCATARCRPGLNPSLPSRRPMLAEAVQPCLATLRATAAWLQAPFRSFPGARAQAGQWPAGVADGWAQAISDMTEVGASPRNSACLRGLCMFRASITVQQHHMHVITHAESVGPT